MKRYVIIIAAISTWVSFSPFALAQDHSGSDEDFRALMVSQFSNTSPTGQTDKVAEYTESYNAAFEKSESERTDKELGGESSPSYPDPLKPSTSGSAVDYSSRHDAD